MVSHNQIIENWLTGNYNPELKSQTVGNSIEIKQKTCPETETDYTALIGYGHAIYAIKVEDTVFLFKGWRERSTTTAGHLTKIRTRVDSHTLVDITGKTGLKRPQQVGTSNLLKLVGQDNLEKLPKPVRQKATANAI